MIKRAFGIMLQPLQILVLHDSFDVFLKPSLIPWVPRFHVFYYPVKIVCISSCVYILIFPNLCPRGGASIFPKRIKTQIIQGDEGGRGRVGKRGRFREFNSQKIFSKTWFGRKYLVKHQV